ncbi:MAG: FHA domain-containing protein [Oscillochloris sp.]|nr:FHA domain-containing protein [Oscillochloris sp.]
MSTPSALCIHCGQPLNRADARFCTHCGKAQVHAAPANAPAATAALGAATLHLQEEGQSRDLTLADKQISLGRAADNDIVCTSRFVSGRHARIEPLGVSHRIVDLGSTNGMLYEGRRVAQHDLADGDVIRIGDPASGSFVTLTYHNSAAQRAPQAAQVSHSYPLDPNDPQITIGRVGCDVVLDNPQVSRFHAQIDRAPGGGAILRDAGSTNGSFVNGQRISAPQQLNAGDVIQVGPFKLVYNLASLDQYDQRGALRIDATGLTRRVTYKSKQRIILHDVSISIAPREFVALVGGSGAGKSTLMKALCGYLPADGGTLRVNGDDFYRNFDAYRTMLGYVPQDDILHRGLPVNRALDYTARMRLPTDTSDQEIEANIDRVLEDVEMSGHRSARIDDLSGGQRKRVSIGAELLAEPSLFFLDEPTSGLDPGLEKKMMYTMRRLADSGRTVVLVTHATANIKECDHVAFMAAGRLVFFGPPAEALSYFGVADFADIYTKLENPKGPNAPLEPQSAVVQRDLSEEYTRWRAAHTQGEPTLAELWEQKYRRSEPYRRYVAERLQQAPAGPVVAATPTQIRTTKVSPLRQLAILTRRYIDITRNDGRNLLILLLQAPLIAVLLLLVARSDALTGVQAIDLIQRGEAKKVLFMLATVSVWFGIINAAREITKELPIYRRERLVNLRIVPYLASKVAVLSLLILLQTAVLVGILALKVQFPADTGLVLPALLEGFVTLGLSAFAGTALGLLISAAADSGDRAISIVPLALIPQILFAGLIFAIEGLAEPLSWLTISRWSMDGLGASMNLNALCNLPNTDDRGGVPPGCTPNFLEIEAAYSHTPGHLLGRWAILLVYALVCLAITAWLLRRRDRQV